MTEQHHGGAAVTDTILHLLTTMQDQLNRMEGKLESLVPRPEYEAFKLHVESALRDVHTHKDSAHARIEHAIAVNGKAIEAVDAKVDAAERDRNAWARDTNLKVWLAILAAALSIAIGFIVRAF